MALLIRCLLMLFLACCSTAVVSNKMVFKGKNYLFVTYGHSVEIKCPKKSSDANVTLYLKRFMKPKQLNVDGSKVLLNKGVFTIMKADSMDGGEYICKAMNKTGHERILKVINVIPVIRPNKNKKNKVNVAPKSLLLQYEDNANISCSALGKRKLKWYKVGDDPNNVVEVDSKKLIFDDHYDSDGGSRHYHSRLILSIKDATKVDSGQYKCVAKSFKIEVEDWLSVSVRAPKKPSIRNFPPVVIASEGISVVLKCKTKGSPRPKITWYHNDKLLGICEGGKSRKCHSFTESLSEFRKNSLTLHRLSHKRNNGRYSCEAENFMGKYTASAQVTIFSKPVLSQRSDTNLHEVTPVQFVKGQSTALRCNVISGYPKPELTWEFQASTCLKKSFACKPTGDWKKLMNWSKDKKEFVVSHPLGPGFYRCVATNMVGQDNQIFAVRKIVNAIAEQT